MTLAELIGPDQVILGLRAPSKMALLSELARRAASATGLDTARILQALDQRERLGSTGLGRGFALPHARIEGCPGFFGLFARLARAVDFAAIDGAPVDLVLLLIGPEEASGPYLATLAAIARPLRDPAFADTLRRSRDARSVSVLLARGSPTA
ncbi:MAG: PTS sugar transporter subunit IIA [Alphaproteobacteria bacterium]|nr:PTS sugar transporter subunit IIA [Alphaproteobacteria bacterium]